MLIIHDEKMLCERFLLDDICNCSYSAWQMLIFVSLQLSIVTGSGGSLVCLSEWKTVVEVVCCNHKIEGHCTPFPSASATDQFGLVV